MKVFGFLGTNGSGKDFVRDYVAEKYADFKITVSDIVNEELQKELGISEADRETKVKFSKSKTDKYGQDYWMKKTIERIKVGKHKLVAVAGLRYPQDIEIFRKEFGKEFTAFWVNVDEKERYSRLVKRGRADAPKSFTEFKAQDKKEMEAFGLDKAKALCDHIIDNNGSPEESNKKIDALMKKLKIGLKQ